MLCAPFSLRMTLTTENPPSQNPNIIHITCLYKKTSHQDHDLLNDILAAGGSCKNISMGNTQTLTDTQRHSQTLTDTHRHSKTLNQHSQTLSDNHKHSQTLTDNCRHSEETQRHSKTLKHTTQILRDTYRH